MDFFRVKGLASIVPPLCQWRQRCQVFHLCMCELRTMIASKNVLDKMWMSTILPLWSHFQGSQSALWKLSTSIMRARPVSTWKCHLCLTQGLVTLIFTFWKLVSGAERPQSRCWTVVSEASLWMNSQTWLEDFNESVKQDIKNCSWLTCLVFEERQRWTSEVSKPPGSWSCTAEEFLSV